MEAFGGGRSFGKKALKLKPVKKNGAEMTFLDYFMRWIFRIPDILFSLGTLAVIMISSSSVAQDRRTDERTRQVRRWEGAPH